jgi:hypothetical protein
MHAFNIMDPPGGSEQEALGREDRKREVIMRKRR